MKKMVLSCLALSILSTLNVTLAAESVKPTYRVKIPLEISNGGRLPNGSIIIGTGNNNGSGGNTGAEQQILLILLIHLSLLTVLMI